MSRVKKLKFDYFIVLVAGAITLWSCSSDVGGPNDEDPPEDDVVTYSKDIAPIISRSCTPCHFPETGMERLLNSHNSVRGNVDEILRRTQLPRDNPEFMPYQLKNTPLNSLQIAKLKEWVENGMPE